MCVLQATNDFVEMKSASRPISEKTPTTELNILHLQFFWTESKNNCGKQSQRVCLNEHNLLKDTILLIDIGKLSHLMEARKPIS